MALSNQGKIFLSSCHMLAPILQMYNGWLERGIGLNWGSQYERIIGWIIEELAYVERLEQLSSDESFATHIEWEKMGDAAFEHFSNQLQSVTGNIEGRYNVNSRELQFVLYCLWVGMVIEKFSEIMKSPELDGTSYQSHYQELETDLNELKRAVNDSLDFQKQKINPTVWEYLAQPAKELADQWSVQVRSISGLS